MEWPPNFGEELARRERVGLVIRSTPDPRETAKSLYAGDPVRFIRDCCITYDPRNPSRGLPARMPFVTFQKQDDFASFLVGLMAAQRDGLVEKSRDMGATWIGVAFSVWLWLYQPGSAVGWGSRKEQLVDKIGDPDSIFEKIRMTIRALPAYCMPMGFSENDHLAYMKCLNPENGSTITGEAGDNIGRGGRKTIYFKDESAHYERPELIEAALGDNTNVQVDISSVCGEGTVFHRKRFSGSVEVFVMDWRDHPGKNEEWYRNRKEKADAQGLGHIFAQEVDRNYSAAVEGIFIPPEWVKASIDAHIKLGFTPSGRSRVALDVADEGADKNVLVDVMGQVVANLDQWAGGDTGQTAIKGWNYCTENRIGEYIYDSVGVGAGVKAKTNELLAMPKNAGLALDVWGFNAGAKVANPDDEYTEGKLNRDMFTNAKAQAWWALRDRFHDTYLAVIKGHDMPEERIISLPSDLPHLDDLVSELSRPKRESDEAGRVRVESKKTMKRRGLPSPNLADALVMAFAPRQVPDVDFNELLDMAMG